MKDKDRMNATILPNKFLLKKYNEFVKEMQNDEELYKRYTDDFNKCIKELNDKFNYVQIVNEQKEVISHILQNYTEWCPYIFQHGIIEQSCEVASEKFTPKPFTTIAVDFLKNCISVPVTLYEEDSFISYNKVKFKRIVVLSPTPELVDSLYTEPDSELEVDGFLLTGLKARGSIVCLGLIRPDLLMFALIFSPKMAYALTKLQDAINSGELINESEKALKGHTKDYYLKTANRMKEKIHNYEYKIDEQTNEIMDLQERNEDLQAKNELLLHNPKNILSEGEIDPDIIPVNKVILLLICIMAIVGIIYIIKLISNLKMSSLPIPNNGTDTEEPITQIFVNSFNILRSIL